MKSRKVILKLLKNVKNSILKVVNNKILKKINNMKLIIIDCENLKYFWFALRKLRRDKIKL